MIPAWMAAQEMQRMRDEGMIRLLAHRVPTSRHVREMKREAERQQRVLKAEPVSTFVGLSALLFNAGIGASVGAAAAIGGTIISLGASVALSAASLALQRTNEQGLADYQTNIGQGSGTLSATVRKPQVGPAPQQRLVLGEVTSSGVLAWKRYDPPYLWHLYLLGAHKSGEFKSLLVNGVDVPLEDPGTGILRANSSPFFDGSIRYIELSYRDGDDDQAMDAIIDRDFPTMPATFRQRGTTAVCLKANYGASDTVHRTVYGTQNNFNPLFRFSGALRYDPRVAGCLQDDQSTWVAGSTASLNFARFFYHQWPSTQLLEIGRFDWDLMAEAADIDDRWRAKADGTLERNHTVDGIILSDADAVQTTQELLSAISGFLVHKNGKYHVLPGAPREPIGTLHQDWLAGGFQLHTETPDREEINIVKTEFIAPDRDHKPVVGPVITDAAYVTADGRPLEFTLTLPFTEGHTRAQRLANRKLKDARGIGMGGAGKRAFTGTFGIGARPVRAGQVWRIEFSDFSKVNGIYMITRSARNAANGTIQIEAVSWANDVFDYTAASDELPFDIDADVLAAEAA